MPRLLPPLLSKLRTYNYFQQRRSREKLGEVSPETQYLVGQKRLTILPTGATRKKESWIIIYSYNLLFSFCVSTTRQHNSSSLPRLFTTWKLINLIFQPSAIWPPFSQLLCSELLTSSKLVKKEFYQMFRSAAHKSRGRSLIISTCHCWLVRNTVLNMIFFTVHRLIFQMSTENC